MRLGLIFDIRNALGGRPGGAVEGRPGRPGARAAAAEGHRRAGDPQAADRRRRLLRRRHRFLLVRARLRDSFVGIEGFAKLDLAGELLLAAQFGPTPAFVLSAGGFHPRYEGLPERVPRDLDRLRVSFGSARSRCRSSTTSPSRPNSVQAGQKTSLKADFGVARIEASLGLDALLYLSPRFFFLVDLEFKAKVKAFGRDARLRRCHRDARRPRPVAVHGEFSFSILWWDKTVPFDERLGEVARPRPARRRSARRCRPSSPTPTTSRPRLRSGRARSRSPRPAPTKLAHPLGRLAIRQRAVPLGLRVERLGTRELAGGPQAVTVASVALNDETLPSFEHTTEPFARGQFVELSDDEKLTGTTFEPFPAGVVVGSADYVTPTRWPAM